MRLFTALLAGMTVLLLAEILPQFLNRCLQYVFAHRIAAALILRLSRVQVLSLCLSITVSVCAIVGAAGLMWLGSQMMVAERRRRQPLNLPRLCLTALMGMGATQLVVLFVLLLPEGVQEAYGAYMGDMPTAYGVAYRLMFFLSHVLLVPVAEELIFRGAAYGFLRPVWGGPVSVLFIGVLFGVTHGNDVQMIYATAMGLLLCTVREVYGDLRYSIAFHMAFNLIGSGLLLPEVTPVIIGVGITLFAVCLLLFLWDGLRGIWQQSFL